jgi:acyl-CoA thioesterase
MTRDAIEIAQKSADAMWAEDTASRALGMRIEKVGPGLAILSMTVTLNMVNGHGLCHGGYIYTLADAAFALACNSHNERHTGQHCAVTFLAPGRLGMRLLAEARERHRGARSGIYDVSVRTDTGETIAEFRGHSRSIAGTSVPET